MSASSAPDISATYAKWADIVIEKWIRKMEYFGIQGDQLVNSFVNDITWAADGSAEKIAFAFEYYGKFVDMGVGNGVNLDNRFMKIDTGLTRRRPKPWFSDVFYRQLAALRHLISERLAQQTQFMIANRVIDATGGEIKL